MLKLGEVNPVPESKEDDLLYVFLMVELHLLKKIVILLNTWSRMW